MGPYSKVQEREGLGKHTPPRPLWPERLTAWELGGKPGHNFTDDRRAFFRAAVHIFSLAALNSAAPLGTHSF